MNQKRVVLIDLDDLNHKKAVILLINEYMKDKMGSGKPMPPELELKILEGLKNHSAYLGFLVEYKNRFIALANCNLNFSTWNARFLINIHDFIVYPEFRNVGVGTFLLSYIKEYALNNNCCKLNLEVREDNYKAKRLYQNLGFTECDPPMNFWEIQLDD